MRNVWGFVSSFTTGIGRLAGPMDRLTVTPTEARQPATYLALSPDGGTLYGVGGEQDGTIYAYQVDGGSLQLRGSAPTGGSHPCHVSLHRGHALVANYGSGSISVHRLGADGAPAPSGTLVDHHGSGPHPRRQAGPHAHMVIPELSGEHVLSTDLGTDRLHRYRWEDGRLVLQASLAMPAGSGPRHLALHPNGRYAYVVGELDSTVTVVELSGSPAITSVTGTVPPDVPSGAAPNLPSDIQLSADGRHCYIANRGHDSIATLAITDDGAYLRLLTTVPCGGNHPRKILRFGDDLLIANQHSNVVARARIDAATGLPKLCDWRLCYPAPSALVLSTDL